MKNSKDLERKVRQSMESYAPKAPMHLFSEIDQKRGFWARLPNYVKYNRNWKIGGLMFGALGLLLLGGVVVSKSYSVEASQKTQLTEVQQSSSTANQKDIKTYNQTTEATQKANDTNSTVQTEQATVVNTNIATAKASQTQTAIQKDEWTAKQAIAQKPLTKTQANALPKRAISEIDLNGGINLINAKGRDEFIRGKQNSLSSDVVYVDGQAQAKAQLIAQPTKNQARESISVLGLLANTQNLERFQGLSEMDAAQFMPRLKCPEPDNGKFIYYVDALISPDYAITEIKGRTAAYDYYAAERRATEEFNYAFSAGLRVSAVTKAGLAFRTGVVYSQITEKFDHTGDSDQIDSITTVVDGQGMIIRQDTAFIQITTQNNNTFKLLDIPLIVGYETYMLQNRLVLTFNGGAYFNISSTPAGKILDANLEPKSVDPDFKGSLMPFKNNFGVSVYGSIGVGYRFNERLAFLVEPQFRYFVKPITVETYELKQGYLTTGLTTGLRMQF